VAQERDAKYAPAIALGRLLPVIVPQVLVVLAIIAGMAGYAVGFGH
jgi:hypothetical protein